MSNAVVQAVAMASGAVNSSVAAASFVNTAEVGTGTGLLANAVQSLQQAASSRTSGAPALIGGNLNVTA